MYNVETKRVNEAVNRNKEKFPNRISWFLNKNELQTLRSQIATSSLTNNYVGKKLLDELRNINRNIIIISSNIDNTLKNKYLNQYSNITFINNNSYHDRFIIIDRKRVFHSGTSFKDLGKKCFDIHEIDDEKIINDFVDRISNMI